ncbi:archaellin/type IV pilin N-terminal domain-containing protein [Thermoplasma volcanium]|nr:archaellin/type IV pilin N-terminal domain-containing protein [Thermoplasma volcanium]
MKLNRQDEAVSPIIATILLIAITIVLAATLYSLLGGYVSLISSPTPTASITITNETSSTSPDSIYSIYVSSVNANVSLTDVKLEIISLDGNVTEAALSPGTIYISDWAITVHGPDYLSALTVITITSQPGNPSPYIKYVKLVDIVTDGTIAGQSLGPASQTS